MAGPTLDDMAKRMLEMREHMARMQGSAQHLSDSFGSFFKSMLQANLAGKLLDPVIGRMEKSILNLSVTMRTPVRLLAEEHILRRKNISELYNAGEITRYQAEKQLRALEAERPMLRLRANLSRAYAKSSKLALGYFGLSVAMIGRMVQGSTALNDALIKSNASWSDRLALMTAGLKTTIRTGQSFGEVLEMQTALVNAGMATTANYQQTLETALMLHKGIGLSVEAATHLAVIVNNQVRGSFEKVSDVLANIVNQTALTADEAARMTKELGTLLTMVRGQSGGTMLPEMTKAVARYEDALKRMTGTSGAFTELVKKASGPQGFGMAGMLGVQSPEMLTTQAGIDTLMKNFKRLGDTMVGESQGWQRRMGLEALAQIMGTSAEEVNGLYLATKNLNAGVTDEMSLRERYLAQTQDLGHSFSQLTLRLTAILERGLYPFVVGLNMLVSTLNRAADALARIDYLPEILSTIAFIAVPAAGIALWGLAKAIWQVAAASAFGKNVLEAQAARRLVGRASESAGVVSRLISFIGANFADILLALAPLAVVAGILKHIYDINKEANMAAAKGRWESGLAYQDLATKMAERAAIQIASSPEKTADIIERAYRTLRQGQKEQGIYGDEAVAQIERMRAFIADYEKRVIIARHQFSDVNMTEKDKVDIASEMAALQAADRIGDKFAKSTKEASEKDRQAEAQRQAFEHLTWYHNLQWGDILLGLKAGITGHPGFQ